MKAWLFLLFAVLVSGQKQERCKNPPTIEEDHGSCAFLTRFYYSKTYNKCFPYYGCLNPNNSTNNFPTQSVCEVICKIDNLATPPPLPASATPQSTPVPPSPRCFLTPTKGVDFGLTCYGDNTQIRYYWSRTAMTCLPFLGCATVRTNNWPSKLQCLANCAGGVVTTTRAAPPSPKSARCTQELQAGVDFGSCGSIMRYYYSAALAKCTSFLGCVNDNGRNNFQSVTACTSECVDSSVAVQSGFAHVMSNRRIRRRF